MPQPRVSIGRLLGWIALIAISLAALRGANDLWVSLTLHLAVAILIWASLQARFATGSVASWWFGFALLGWPHLLSWSIESSLLTDILLRRAIYAPFSISPETSLFVGMIPDGLGERFQIAHNLFSLVAGWLGGWGVMGFAAWQRRRSVSTALTPGDD